MGDDDCMRGMALALLCTIDRWYGTASVTLLKEPPLLSLTLPRPHASTPSLTHSSILTPSPSFPPPPCRYVERVTDFLLNRSIKKPFEAFASGFRILCDGPAMRLFNAQVRRWRRWRR